MRVACIPLSMFLYFPLFFLTLHLWNIRFMPVICVFMYGGDLGHSFDSGDTEGRFAAMYSRCLAL